RLRGETALEEDDDDRDDADVADEGGVVDVHQPQDVGPDDHADAERQEGGRDAQSIRHTHHQDTDHEEDAGRQEWAVDGELDGHSEFLPIGWLTPGAYRRLTASVLAGVLGCPFRSKAGALTFLVAEHRVVPPGDGIAVALTLEISLNGVVADLHSTGVVVCLDFALDV